MDIVAVDIGGTNARFAIASVEAGRVLKLGPPLTLKTNAHVGLEAAWAVFAASTEQPLPRKAAIAVAAPVEGDVVRSEEHTSELQSLMRISYAVFCLKKKK